MLYMFHTARRVRERGGVMVARHGCWRMGRGEHTVKVRVVNGVRRNLIPSDVRLSAGPKSEPMTAMGPRSPCIINPLT
jgi:hypothetical protein